jgi:hypothetical protein
VQTLTKLYAVNADLARSYAVVTHALGYIATSVIGLYYILRDKLHLTEALEEGDAQIRPEVAEKV